MKKKFIIISMTSLLTALSAFFVFNSESPIKRMQGAEDYYSITINAEDITTSTTEVSGTFVGHTDQLNNPISFDYENIKYQLDGETKYLVFGEGAWFANNRDSQIRRIEKFTVYGDNGAFTYDYGWGVNNNAIDYTGLDHSSSANGSDISLGDNQPNYLVLKHRNNQADVKISKIVFAYSKACTAGEKPTPVLDHITLSGQITSLNRGASFSFGGTVTAHYTDGSTSNVTSQTTFSGYNMAKAGNYTVTASYTENAINKTATYTLTINKAWSTVWSGSRKIGDGGSSSFTFGNVAFVTGLKLRSSFSSMSAWTPSSGDEVSVTYLPSNGSTSPYTVTSFSSNFTYLLKASIYNSSRQKSGTAYVGYNKSTGAISGTYNCSRPDYTRAYITVTKIEAYY